MPRDDPPSYEAVVQKLNELAGPDATPQKIFNAANELSQTDINVLAANPDELPPWTPDTKNAFTVGLAKEMVSPDAAENIRVSAKQATDSCKLIEALFVRLTTELASIDAKNLPPKEGAFAPRLATLNKAFREVVIDSKDLALKIAIYGRRFDEMIVPIATDPNISVQRRLEILQGFIDDADDFAEEAELMSGRFFTLKSDFAIFTGSFSGWALDKEEEDTKELQQARKDLELLNEKLAKLKISFYAIGAVAAASLPLTGVIATLSGPFAPVVIVAGLIAAGVTLGTAIGLYFAMRTCQGDIEAKDDQIERLEKEIQEIKAARGDLIKLGSTSMDEFSTNIDTLSTFWENVHNDALRVKEWLEGGAEVADIPEYLKIALDNSLQLYKTMAQYLDEYADGVMKF